MGRGSRNWEFTEDDEVTEITEITASSADNDEEPTQVLPFLPVTTIETPAPATPAPFGDRRRHPRYDSAITAVVYTANGSFRTTTLNLSEGGVRLSQALPAEFQFVGLEVLMIEERTEGAYRYYLFKAKAVGGTGKRDRLQFTWIPAETLSPYRDYLTRLGKENIGGAAA